MSFAACDPQKTESPFLDECTTPRAMALVADALVNPEDPCRAWVASTYGRATASGSQSGVVWSLRPLAKNGLFISANHTLGEGAYGPVGSDVSAALTNPTDPYPDGSPKALVRARLAETSGELSALVSPIFPLFHPSIPAAETGNQLRDIHPRHDYFVAAIDGQKRGIRCTSSVLA